MRIRFALQSKRRKIELPRDELLEQWMVLIQIFDESCSSRGSLGLKSTLGFILFGGVLVCVLKRVLVFISFAAEGEVGSFQIGDEQFGGSAGENGKKRACGLFGGRERLSNLWVQRGEARMDRNVEFVERGDFSKHPARRKVIIDTDPGIDDMMAIFMAFEAPEIDVLGITTIFGNVDTDLATINALHLCEMAGHPEVPVSEGPSEPLKRVKPRIAYFVHGSDGLGETYQAKPKGQKSSKSAADFLIEKVAEFPGEVTMVALGPLTNIALAIQKDPSFAKNIGQLVVLGGAFNASGNVNPAAEANIFGDPEAADVVFTSGLNTLTIGINLTTQVIFNAQDLIEIKESGGKYAQYVYDCCRFYHDWHFHSDHFDGIFLHDPTCMAALLDPTLFTFKKGAVRVETEGLCVGHTLLDMGLKNWVGNNPWIGVPPIDVGITVDADGVRNLVKKLLCSC